MRLFKRLVTVTLIAITSCTAIFLFKIYQPINSYSATLPHSHAIDTQKQNKNTQCDSVHPGYIINPLNTLAPILEQLAPTMNRHIIQIALATLNCASNMNIPHNQILTIIDYSLPTHQKRLWVFDLEQKRLLYHTYIAHGIKSGTVFTNQFSNKNDSKSTSMGVYLTDQAYYGREGTALKLIGLDPGVNDNAANRSIVMHGGWYVDEKFIQKYGRTGRSWGCPALPLHSAKAIINTIKDQSIIIAYYPNEDWLTKSPFLRCDPLLSMQILNESQPFLLPEIKEPEGREDILFIDVNGNQQREENEPIIVLEVKKYEAFINKKAPLGRMLRRQVNQSEYIALTQSELKQLISEKNLNNALEQLNLVIPEITMEHGYYQTHMKIISLGQIEHIHFNGDPQK